MRPLSNFSPGPFAFLTMFAFLVQPTLSSAEFVCRGETSYVWERSSSASDMQASQGGSDSKASQGVKEYQVFWSSSEASGPDEDSAKEALRRKLEEERSKARMSCKRDHENVALCIASKFSAMGSVLQRLDFQARRTLQDSIASDCAMQQGVCTKASSSDPVCKDVTPKGEGEEAEGKGKKKK